MKKLLLALLLLCLSAPALAANTPKESAFARVTRTKTIRCGYIIVGDAIVAEPNTGKLSGIVHDLVEEVAKILDLKVEWTEEATFGTFVQGLEAGRYDIVCTSLYARPNVMAHLEMTEPYYYVPINVYARKGDDRFHAASDIDKPDIKVSSQDNTIPALIRQTDFPHAADLSLPDSDYSDILMSVAAKKADLTFVEPAIASRFLATHPDSLEVVKTVSPLRVFPVVLGMPKGEHDLDTMLSWAIRYLHANGRIEAILRKYERYPGSFLRAATPYEESHQ